MGSRDINIKLFFEPMVPLELDNYGDAVNIEIWKNKFIRTLCKHKQAPFFFYLRMEEAESE